MTDKVSMELEAEEDGYLIAILKGDGETVPVTEVIGYLGRRRRKHPNRWRLCSCGSTSSYNSGSKYR